MQNFLFSIAFISLLFVSSAFTPVELVSHHNDVLTELENDLSNCSLSFTYNQDYSCCNTTNDGCACVDITVSGLYGYGCQGSVTGIWFESIFLCSQGQWSGTSPTIQIDLDLYAACSGSCQYVNIPVTMKYTYDCGYGSCQGSYSKTIQMLIC